MGKPLLAGPRPKSVSVYFPFRTSFFTRPSKGTSADLQYFVAPLDAVKPGSAIPWRRISGPDDHVYGMTAFGDRLLVIAYADAPRYKVLELDAANGTLAAARDFVPQREDLLDSVVLAQDGAYVSYQRGGVFQLERVSWNGARENVSLPYAGRIYDLTASPDRA